MKIKRETQKHVSQVLYPPSDLTQCSSLSKNEILMYLEMPTCSIKILNKAT
jgi:hypothetical protein